MEKNIKISIVLPIYNVEKYLERCLKSVIRQTYSNIEIILVDDGSPDSCPQVCDAYAKEDERIKVIHKKNEGLGMARNTGLSQCTGDYVWFVDSDDFIDENSVEIIVERINSEKPDVVLFGYSSINKNNELIFEHIPSCPTYVISDKKEILDYVLPDLINETRISKYKKLYMSAWACVYSMKLINNSNWDFVSEREIISEDVYSNLKLYSYVNKISIINKSLYFYCENAASLTRTYKSDRFEKICYFHKMIHSEAVKLNYGEKILSRLQEPFISNLISAIKLIAKAEISEKQKYVLLKNICNDNYLKEMKWYNNKANSRLRSIFTFLIRKRQAMIIYIITAFIK